MRYNFCWLPTRPALLVITVLGLLTAWQVNAQLAGGDFAIRRSTIDAGGGPASGGNFELHGTIGQPDAGNLSGGAYELKGGFWTPDSSDLLFKDSYEG